MPKKSLTDRFVASDPAAASYFDTTIKGLALRVTPAGGKLWAFVYRVQGKGPQWLKLGTYPATSLLKARTAAKAHRRAVDDGHDPVAEAKAAAAAAAIPPAPVAPVLTVRTFAKTFVAFQKGKKKTWANDEQTVAKYLLPAWGDLPVTSITRTMIAELLTAISSEGLTVGVNRIQMLISRFFAIAIDQGVYGTDANPVNPAARMIKRFDETARERVLREPEIRTLRAELDARPSEAADVVWLRLLLGQRAEETAGMIWSELDLEARTWFLNGVRTKNGSPHLLWLPDLALAILTRRQAEADPNQKHVFPTMAGEQQPKAERDLATVKARFENFEWKDLRRTFSTSLGDLGIDDGVIDRLLNHKAASVGRRHYNHAKYLPEKQVALAAWDRELTRILKNEPKTSRVIPMPAR